VVVLIAAIMTIAAGYSAASNFAMTTDSSALLSPDVDWRVNERRLDAAFPQNGDVILVVIDGKTPELAENAAAGLAAALATDGQHFRGVRRPDGGPFFARAGLLFASPAEVSATTARLIEAQPLLGPLAADPSLRGIAGMFDTLMQGVERGDAPLSRFEKPMAAMSNALEKKAIGKSAWFSWGRLFEAHDSTLAAPSRRLLLVRPRLDYTDLQPGAAAADAICAAAAALKLDATHGLSVRLTGSTPLDDEEFSSLEDNAGLVAGAIIVSMLGVLWLATRSWRIVAAIMISTLAGLVVTAAAGLAIVGRFNLISVAFIPLFVGLGVDFGIQLGVRFQAERQKGIDPVAAMRAAAAALGPSLLLAAAAICLGFLAFLPTEYVGIAELGIISSAGMIVALLFSATLLPALLVLFRPGPPAVETPSPRLAALDSLLLRRRGLVLGAFALSVVATIAALPLVEFDFNPLHLKSPNGEAVRTLADLGNDPDRSPNTIDILAPSLPAARALAARLEKLPDVARALTVESFVPVDQAAKLPLIADANALLEFTLDPIEVAPPPGDPETIAALRHTAAALAVAAKAGPAGASAVRLGKAFEALAAASPRERSDATEMLVAPLQVLLGQLRDSLAAEPVTLATLPADLKRDWLAPDGRARVQLVPRANDNATLSRFTAEVRAIVPEATGVAVSTQAAAKTVATAFVQAGILALVIVSLLLFAVLRSVREVAFTLAPVVLSGFLTLGTCVVISQPINFANIIAFPLLFGVGVAFHIYFVMAWRGGASDLLQSSLARGVFFSALATGMAFGSLWLSAHTGTASMGKILMISLAWTLVCALIFEPALLGPQKPNAKPVVN
jgi:hopanoid biosynthesis associated RND transporter like protein HpnN